MWRSQNMVNLLYRGQTCEAQTSGETYVKTCFFDKNLTSSDFDKEVNNLMIANKFKIGPQLIEVNKEEDKGIIKMQDLTSNGYGYKSLEEICEKFTMTNYIDDVFQDNFLNLIGEMLRSGFMHMDLNHGNIMVNNEKKVQLIDFAQVQFFDPAYLHKKKAKEIVPIPYLGMNEKISLYEVVREAMTSFTGDMLECSSSVPDVLKNDESITNLVFEKIEQG